MLKKYFFSPKVRIIPILVFFFTTSCSITFDGNFENTPTGNYDFFFYELEQVYAYKNYLFENNYTLAQIRELERANILANPSWNNLAIVLGRVIYQHIADPHLYPVYSPVSNPVVSTRSILSTKRTTNYDVTQPSFPNQTFSNLTLETTHWFDYSTIVGTNSQAPIGYFYIKNLTPTSQSYSDIEKENKIIADTLDRILRNFQNQNVASTIIDIRSPAGGSIQIAEIIASRFLTSIKPYGIFEDRISQNRIIRKTISAKPAGFTYYSGFPLVVLVNTNTCSAGELLLLMLRQADNLLTTIGTSTLGCTGVSLYRELPNGWIFRITSSRNFELDGRDYFKVGINPDITLTAGLNNAVLKEAIRIIRSQP